MPRGPRVDVPDGLYHVIARGGERRPIFRTDLDREDCLRRVATVVAEENLRLSASVLMGNHSHLVVRRAGAALVFPSITAHLRALRRLGPGVAMD